MQKGQAAYKMLEDEKTTEVRERGMQRSTKSDSKYEVNGEGSKIDEVSLTIMGLGEKGGRYCTCLWHDDRRKWMR